MRKAITLTILLLSASMLFASFSFSFGPEQTFFSQFASDTLSPKLRLGAFYQTSTSRAENAIMFNTLDAEGKPTEVYYAFTGGEGFRNNSFIHLQAGGGVSALRMGWKGAFEASLSLEARISTVFFLTGGTDMLGVDGSYFVGAEASILDRIRLRGGIRHYSGHIGDEVLKDVLDSHRSENLSISEYVLDAYEASIGYSDDAFPYIRAALGITVPQKKSYMVPVSHRPDWIISGSQTTAERYPAEYAVRGDYGPGYNALIVFGEAALSYPFFRNSIDLVYDFAVHQDGMTNHTLTPDDDTDKWEWEHRISLVLKRVSDSGHGISVELFYHMGRFPLLNYYWKRSDYGGFCISVFSE